MKGKSGRDAGHIKVSEEQFTHWRQVNTHEFPFIADKCLEHLQIIRGHFWHSAA